MYTSKKHLGMLKIYLNYMNISLYLENKCQNEMISEKIHDVWTCNRDVYNLETHSAILIQM